MACYRRKHNSHLMTVLHPGNGLYIAYESHHFYIFFILTYCSLEVHEPGSGHFHLFLTMYKLLMVNIPDIIKDDWS